MKTVNFKNLLLKLQCQYLCCYPVKNILWQELTETPLSWEEQAQLVQATHGCVLNQKLPINISYQLSFFKRLIEILEKSTSEVHDQIYEAYCAQQLLASQISSERYAYKHYLLPVQQTHLSLRESKSFVAEGTTGLCSWQACLALADFLLHHSSEVQHKTILELGAGTGLCGFILAKCCAVRHMQISDGSLECIQLMRENIAQNFANIQKTVELDANKYVFQLKNSNKLTAFVLEWASIEAENAATFEAPELILASDVVYDDSVFEDLCKAIEFAFNKSTNTQTVKLFLAATIRNETTMCSFLKLMEEKNFMCQEMSVIATEQSFLHWDRSTPVKIFLFTKQKQK